MAVTLACHSSSFAFKHDSSLDNVKAPQFPGPWRVMETRLEHPHICYREMSPKSWLYSGAIVPQGPLPSSLRAVGTGLHLLGS